MARNGVPAELVLLDWHMLHETGQLDPEDSLNHRIGLAAPRIGMSVGALEIALRRAGIRNPVERSLQARHNRSLSCRGCRNYRVAITQAKSDLAQIAKRLARDPDNSRLQAALERAQEDLAYADAGREDHMLAEHRADAA
jgi:hypothetical protein